MDRKHDIGRIADSIFMIGKRNRSNVARRRRENFAVSRFEVCQDDIATKPQFGAASGAQGSGENSGGEALQDGHASGQIQPGSYFHQILAFQLFGLYITD
jgi:hypothetical protein